MRSLALILVASLVGALAACRPAPASGPTVVAGSYPLAEMARALVGDDAEVIDLTPSGAEPHDLELSPKQVDRILDADLLIYIGGGFQPAVADVAPRAPRSLDVLKALGRSTSSDPHVWLDPAAMADLVSPLQAALSRDRPQLREALMRRGLELRTQLRALDVRWRTGLTQCQRRLLVTAHAAFGSMAQRYGLRMEAIAGLSPESEPDPQRLDQLRQLVKDEGVTTVFTEELVSPAVARTLARETGAATAVLDPLESARRLGDPGYIARMDANLAAVRKALGCS